MQPGTEVPPEFTETFLENFNLVDEDKDGFLTREEASILFRGLGQTPTESEMKELVRTLPGQISFDVFRQWFGTNYQNPSTEAAITKAFGVFDLSNSGVLPLTKFRELLTSLGDSMSKDEVGYSSAMHLSFPRSKKSCRKSLWIAGETSTMLYLLENSWKDPRVVRI